METTFSKDSATGNGYISFFDLDLTITRTISGKELIRGAIKKGIMAPSDIVHSVYLLLLYKLNLRDPLKIIDDMVMGVKGMPEKTMTDLCSGIFRDVLLPSVYSEARSEIKFHKDNNGKVVLLSSTLAPLCQEFAKDLLLDDILCSRLEVKNGYLTGRPIGRMCFGEEKTVRLREYCELNNTSLSDVWYYADSISDLPALSSVGIPVCVNPDKKLRKAAVKRGWKILYWRS
jgi:putative phosphoserine phosphatase / 1-acylglycerol-3-phosphate O-acyltransferase